MAFLHALRFPIPAHEDGDPGRMSEGFFQPGEGGQAPFERVGFGKHGGVLISYRGSRINVAEVVCLIKGLG